MIYKQRLKQKQQCRQLTANQGRKKYWNEMNRKMKRKYGVKKMKGTKMNKAEPKEAKTNEVEMKEVKMKKIEMNDKKHGVMKKMNEVETNEKMTRVKYISEMIVRKDLDGRSKVNRLVEKWFKEQSQFIVEKEVEPIMEKIDYAIEKGMKPALTEGEIQMAKAWIIMTNNVTDEADLKMHLDGRRTIPMMTDMDLKANGEFTLMDLAENQQKDPNIVVKLPKEVFEKIRNEPIDRSIDIDELKEKSIEEVNKKRAEAKNKSQQITSQKMAVMNQTHQAITPNAPMQMKLEKQKRAEPKGDVIDTVWKNGYAEYKGKPIKYDPYDATFMVNKVQRPSRKAAIPLKMRIVGIDVDGILAIPLMDHFLKQKEEHDKQRDERRKEWEEQEKKELEECKKRAFEAVAIVFDNRVRLFTENPQYQNKILVMSREMKAQMLMHPETRGTWLIATADQQNDNKNEEQNLVYVRMVQQVKDYDKEQERQLKLKIFGVEEVEFEGYIYTFRGKLTVTSTMKNPEKSIYIPARYRNIRQITELNLPDILSNMGRWKLRFHHLNEQDNTIVVDPIEYLGRYEDKQTEN